MANLDSPLHDIAGSLFRAGNFLPDAVIIKIGTKQYDGWDTVSINRDLEAMTSSFTVTVSDKWRQTKETWPFNVGNQVRISTNGKSIFNGYIDALDVNVSNEDRSISFSGRDKTGDLVDSAAIGLSATYSLQNIVSIAQIYATKFGITVTGDTADALVPFQNVTVQQSETIFELLSRLAKEKGLLLTSTPEGNLSITDRKGLISQRTTDIRNPTKFNVALALGDSTSGLKQGGNIISARATFDEVERFQTYLVKSQVKGTDFINAKDSTTINGVAVDPNVKRSRTKYIIADKSMDNAGAKAYAEWQANIHAVGSSDIEIVVQGWTNAKGEVWDINEIVDVDARFIGLTPQKMLIVGVSFSQNVNSGTLTSIRLARLDSFQAQPEVSEKREPSKDAGWEEQIYGSYQSAIDAMKGL